MNAPDPTPAPPPDPTLQAQQQQAQQSLISNLQKQTQGDMATLMARYGTQLAVAGYTGGSPLTGTVVTPGRAG